MLSLNVPTYTYQVTYFMVRRIVLDGKTTGKYLKGDDCVAMESGLGMWTTSVNPPLDLPVWLISGLKKLAHFNFGKVMLG